VAAQIEAEQSIALLRQRRADVRVAPGVFPESMDKSNNGFWFALRRPTTRIQANPSEDLKVHSNISILFASGFNIMYIRAHHFLCRNQRLSDQGIKNDSFF
jgi:hypothetical protein